MNVCNIFALLSAIILLAAAVPVPMPDLNALQSALNASMVNEGRARESVVRGDVLLAKAGDSPTLRASAQKVLLQLRAKLEKAESQTRALSAQVKEAVTAADVSLQAEIDALMADVDAEALIEEVLDEIVANVSTTPATAAAVSSDSAASSRAPPTPPLIHVEAGAVQKLAPAKNGSAAIVVASARKPKVAVAAHNGTAPKTATMSSSRGSTPSTQPVSVQTPVVSSAKTVASGANASEDGTNHSGRKPAKGVDSSFKVGAPPTEEIAVEMPAADGNLAVQTLSPETGSRKEVKAKPHPADDSQGKLGGGDLLTTGVANVKNANADSEGSEANTRVADRETGAKAEIAAAEPGADIKSGRGANPGPGLELRVLVPDTAAKHATAADAGKVSGAANAEPTDFAAADVDRVLGNLPAVEDENQEQDAENVDVDADGQAYASSDLEDVTDTKKLAKDESPASQTGGHSEPTQDDDEFSENKGGKVSASVDDAQDSVTDAREQMKMRAQQRMADLQARLKQSRDAIAAVTSGSPKALSGTTLTAAAAAAADLQAKASGDKLLSDNSLSSSVSSASESKFSLSYMGMFAVVLGVAGVVFVCRRKFSHLSSSDGRRGPRRVYARPASAGSSSAGGPVAQS